MNVHQIILKGIKEQLFLNDYLVIPNFGGFVLRQTSSHFSASGTLLMPPAKTVSFNAQLKQNDGVFMQWLQAQLKCDGPQALAHLADFAEYCKSLLQNRGRLTVDGIGFFYTDFENNICFEPQQQANFLAASFGLLPVTAKELEPEVIEKTEPVFVDRTIHVTTQEAVAEVKKKRNYRSVAIAAVSGAVIFSALVLLVSNNTISGKLKASVFGTSAHSTYTPVAYSPLVLNHDAATKKDYVADANGVATIQLDSKTIAVQAVEYPDKTLVARSKTPRSHVNFTRKNFDVVLGCFSVLSNANKMVNKLSQQNIRAAVTGQNEKGLFVVSSGSFDTKEEAINQLASVKSIYPNAWVKSNH